MSTTLQRTLLPDNCALITSKLDDGRFQLSLRQVRVGMPETVAEYEYEPAAWRKAGRHLDVLIAKLREHDNLKAIGEALVDWIDENRPMLPREM